MGIWTHSNHLNICPSHIHPIFRQGIITFLVLVAVSDEVKGCWKEAYKGSSIEKFGDAFISMGAGLGTLHSKRVSTYSYMNS